MAELVLSDIAKFILEERYLLRGDGGEIIENPEQLFRRVAHCVAQADKKYNGEDIDKTEEKFYEMMMRKDFAPNSPTFFNAGNGGSLSACFAIPISDDLQKIGDCFTTCARIHQMGGGTGIDFSPLRPKGDIVKSTKGCASGPISFMSVLDKFTGVIKQGGCVSQENYIRTSKGTLQAKELLNCSPNGRNQSGLSIYNGNGSFSEIGFVDDNGLANTLKIKTDIGNELEVTEDHLLAFINKDGDLDWKKAGGIKVGDWLIIVMSKHVGKDEDLPNIGYQHFNATKLKIANTMNKYIGELLGFYMANGCTSTNGRIVLSVCPQDKDVCIQLEEDMKKSFNLHSSHHQTHRGSIDMFFTSRDLIKYFEKMNWKKYGSPKAFIPDIIFRSSKETIRGFLRGLFEGDGSVHADGYILYCSTSKNLIIQLQQLLLSIGIVSKTRYDVIVKSGNRHGHLPLNYLSIIQDESVVKFINDVGFMSKRKMTKIRLTYHTKSQIKNDVLPNQEKKLKQIYDNYIESNKQRFYDKIWHFLPNIKNRRNLTRNRFKILSKEFSILKNDPWLNQLANTKYFYTSVIDIKETKANTMDVEVIYGSKFTLNGFLVHNKRRGANIGILRVDHPDILDFIKCKDVEGTFENFNISIAITDSFMEAFENDKDYELYNPRTMLPVGKISAKKVWNELVSHSWKLGEPGIIFITKVNKYNPTPNLGKITTCNPCSELFLLPLESCNLGSINLLNFITEKTIKWKELEECIYTAVHFLDNVIDVNSYPLPEIEEATKKTRKIGLGLMGLHDTLIKQNIRYDSDKAVSFAEKIMRFINEKALEASCKLAEIRGPFPAIKGSIYDEPFGLKPRNASRTCLAPTGSISQIVGVSSGIEPNFDYEYDRIICEKKFKIRHWALDDEIIDKKVLLKSTDIDWHWHIKIQAAFQKYVDSAISKTILLPYSATKQDVSNAMLLAYKLGCKSITVYRNDSRKKQIMTNREVCPECGDEVIKEGRCKKCINCTYSSCNL